MYTETFAKKLKKARKDTGLTQREVEEETKIYQTAISRYEKGEREPDLETLAILADFYQVSVDWLLGTKGNNK